MKSFFTGIVAILCCLFSFSQSQQESALEFQNALNEKYKDSLESPLTEADRQNFEGLDFYPIDEKFIVEADFERADDAVPFKMKTTTNRLPTYEVYGVATFIIDDIKIKLNIYQNHSLRDKEEYQSYLFLPFTDLTNGDGTYTGGRFLDLEIPNGDKILIDFNKAYNPYCAYNYKYSCPIPPKENDIDMKITAGVKH